MKPDPADSFASVLSSVETGTLVRVESPNLPGRGQGPAGIETVQGVVVAVLIDSGRPEGIGRYFRTLRLRDGSGDDPQDYRLDYRGVGSGQAWIRHYAAPDPFSGPDEWGTRRRVYAIEVEGNGITARTERPGNSFDSVPTDTQDYE